MQALFLSVLPDLITTASAGHTVAHTPQPMHQASSTTGISFHPQRFAGQISAQRRTRCMPSWFVSRMKYVATGHPRNLRRLMLPTFSGAYAQLQCAGFRLPHCPQSERPAPRLSDQFKGLLFADSLAKLFRSIPGHSHCTSCTLPWVFAPLAARRVCDPALRVGHGDHLGLFDHRFHHLTGENGCLVEEWSGPRNVAIRLVQAGEGFPVTVPAEVLAVMAAILRDEGVLVFQKNV